MYGSIPDFTLLDGNRLPAQGFGTYPLKGKSGCQVVLSALESGYRLIDTAYNYENEGAVGRAIQESALSRHEIFVCSKLPGRYQAFDKAISCIEESLYRTKLDYFDLYLIHWPNPKQGLYIEAWQALIEAQSRGYLRSIGVSNFLPEHIETLEKETGVLPVVNQLEIHPRFSNLETKSWNQERGIVTQSWSPLARGAEVINHPVIRELSHRHGRTCGQIILRWHYQLGCLAIPKASTASRQKENLAIFDFSLSDQDMHQIGQITQPDGRLKGQDPATYEEY